MPISSSEATATTPATGPHWRTREKLDLEAILSLSTLRAPILPYTEAGP